MLAQNFKTATDLHLTDREHHALVTVLGMLERGEIQAAESGEHIEFNEHSRFTPVGFNMLKFYAEAECGTVCCICGWAEFVGTLPVGSLVQKRLSNPALSVLFDPTAVFTNISPSQAATALRNYLTSGEPRWTEAMAGV